MRARYYRLKSCDDLPDNGLLVHIYRREAALVARLDGDTEQDETAPDLVFFRAALVRLRLNLIGTFVRLEDDAAWQPEWGDLVDYRGHLKCQEPAPYEMPPSLARPDIFNAWDYTLNLNSITSPSFTT